MFMQKLVVPYPLGKTTITSLAMRLLVMEAVPNSLCKLLTILVQGELPALAWNEPTLTEVGR